MYTHFCHTYVQTTSKVNIASDDPFKSGVLCIVEYCDREIYSTSVIEEPDFTLKWDMFLDQHLC